MLSALLLGFVYGAPSPKTVNVVLKSSWNSTSLLVEASEFFPQDLYWRFIDGVFDQVVGGKTISSDSDEHDVAMKVASSLTGSTTVDVLAYSLAIRQFSPAAHTYRTLMPDAQCDAIVLHSGLESSCGLDDVNLKTISSTTSEVYSFDRVFGGGSVPNSTATDDGASQLPATVIAVLSLHSARAAQVHRTLSKAAADGLITYVFRPQVSHTLKPLQVCGFGVELALKNMEYKVLDDNKIEISDENEAPTELLDEEQQEMDVKGFYFNKLAARHPDVSKELNALREELLAHTDDQAKINVWDMKDLGLAASQRILRAKDPLAMMRDLSQNMPMYMSGLCKLRVDPSVRTAFSSNTVTPGLNVVTLNGVSLDLDEVDLFSLQAMAAKEALTVDRLRGLAIPTEGVRALLNLPPLPKRNKKRGGFGQQSDPTRLHMGVGAEADAVTFWLNDISKDERYVSWSKTVQELVSPGWPNQLRYVRKNLYHGIVAIDPSTYMGLDLFERAKYFVEANAPVRTGVLFVLPQEPESGGQWPDKLLNRDDYKDIIPKEHNTKKGSFNTNPPSVVIAKLFWYLARENTELSWKFLLNLHGLKTDVDEKAAMKAFASIVKGQKSLSTAAEVLEMAEANEFIAKCRAFTKARDITQSKVPAFILNGQLTSAPQGGGRYRDILMNALLPDQMRFMRLVYEGKLDDSMDVQTFLFSQGDVFPRISPHIVDHEPTTVDNLNTSSLRFYHSTVEGREHHVNGASLVVSCDLELNSACVDLALAAIDYTSTSLHPDFHSRVGFMPAPSSSNNNQLNALGRFIVAVGENVNIHKKANNLVRQGLALARYFERDEELFIRALKKLMENAPRSVSTAVNDDKWVGGWSPQLASRNGAATGKVNILVNARLFTFPDDISYDAAVEDVKLLEHMAYRAMGADKVIGALENVNYEVDSELLTTEWVDNVVMEASLVLNARNSKQSSTNPLSSLLDFEATNPAMISAGDSNSFFQFRAVLDPVSKEAQRILPLLITARDSVKAEIKIILNPTQSTEYPLKRFYRMATPPPTLEFDAKGALKSAYGAVFRNIYSSNVLTMGVDVPESWKVFSQTADYDLDNLRLEELGSMDTLNVGYGLENLLIAGQCIDFTLREPTAGLQLDLSSASQGAVADTQVMQNLGYFQLPANPGVWKVSAHGLANSIYTIRDAKVRDNDTFPSYLTSVRSFNDPWTTLQVSRVEGKENVKLEDLQDHDGSDEVKDGSGLWSSLNIFKKPKTDNETIHIFSVASGHLYERFLKIMMLSLVNKTKSPVKFWFISNFFSPQFKQFVPDMATRYGYEVEFVSYKWPSWLRRQEEKQRIIWGYKILFLDVLFPLKLRRVIYIDADQVIRGDVKELWDMDLKGAPYAYTPFCDSNPDTEGFRFWKQGYWADHLRGMPYHISALYVVDLTQFRRQRAGDSLRMVYDGLSQDKNSLANLDQDLPNYAQHAVPIFSLPQEWLWCQTWCSMETLSTAKTIDLCNNPLTKRPKLEVAKELLPEWEVYDNEAKRFEQQLSARQSSSTKRHDEL